MKKAIVIILAVISVILVSLNIGLRKGYEFGYDEGYGYGYHKGICRMAFQIVPNKTNCHTEKTNSGILLILD